MNETTDYLDSVILAFLNQCGIDMDMESYPHDSLMTEVMGWDDETYDTFCSYLPYLQDKGHLTANQSDVMSFHVDMARGNSNLLTGEL